MQLLRWLKHIIYGNCSRVCSLQLFVRLWKKHNKAKRRKEKISIKDDSYSNDIESC